MHALLSLSDRVAATCLQEFECHLHAVIFLVFAGAAAFSHVFRAFDGEGLPVDTQKAKVLVWIAVLVAVNLQTSFLTPPFGFALFFLKGSAPPEIRITDIYRGIVPFVMLQIGGMILVALVSGVGIVVCAVRGGLRSRFQTRTADRHAVRGLLPKAYFESLRTDTTDALLRGLAEGASRYAQAPDRAPRGWRRRKPWRRSCLRAPRSTRWITTCGKRCRPA